MTSFLRWQRGDRSNVQNVAILVTNGATTNPTEALQQAQQLQSGSGAYVFALGVTNQVSDWRNVMCVTLGGERLCVTSCTAQQLQSGSGAYVFALGVTNQVNEWRNDVTSCVWC